MCELVRFLGPGKGGRAGEEEGEGEIIFLHQRTEPFISFVNVNELQLPTPPSMITHPCTDPSAAQASKPYQVLC